MINVTFVFPIIQKNYIDKALKTLKENTPGKVRAIVVDQTVSGWDDKDGLADLILKPGRNLGFAKAMNEGIIHGLHWGSEYVVPCNDDVEFIDPRWWQGIMDQFEAFPKMMAVNPASVIEPGWGYGYGTENFNCPDWGVEVGGNIYPKKKDGTAFTYEQAIAPGGYDWLLKDYKQGHIEGFAGWCIVMSRENWEKVGLYDERFTPGGGEDYDLCHRIYLAGGRASATMRSWVWHWWGKSKDIVHIPNDGILPVGRDTFQSVNDLYISSPEGGNSPIYPPRDNKPFNNKMKRKSPGIFIDDIG